MKTFKKILSVMMVLAVICGTLSGCGSKASSKEIAEAAKPYMKAILSRKISQILKLSTPDFKDYKKQWSGKLSFSLPEYTSEDAEICEAIADSISYTIDEDSAHVDGKYGEGYIDVNVTMADYRTLSKDYDIMESVDTFTDAIIDDNSDEFVLRLEFEKVGDDWLVSNHEEILSTCYSFTDCHYTFYPDLSDVIYGISFYTYDSSWNYDNTDFKNVSDLYVSLDYKYGSDISQVYCTVEYNGMIIYTSTRGADYFDLDISTGSFPTDSKRPNAFASGDYSITVYDGRDRVITSETVTLTNTEYRPWEQFDWYFATSEHGDYAIYNNADELDLDIMDHYYDSDLYYTVAYNGEVVFTSDKGLYEGYLYASDVPSLRTPSGYLVAGLYEITFYDDAAGICYGGCTAIVTNNNLGPDGNRVSAYLGYDIIGDTFSYEWYCAMGDPYWVLEDGSHSDFGTYSSGVKKIQLSVPVEYDFGSVSYYVEYSANGDTYNIDQAADTVTVDVVSSGDGMSYDLVLEDSSALADGYYIIYSQVDGEEPFVTSYCRVGDFS